MAIDCFCMGNLIAAEVCRAKYLLTTCKPSIRCSTGRICMDTTYSPCCEPSPSDCPTTVQLGFQCNVTEPTSWCRQSEDCRRRKCCPIGYNYNISV